MTPNCAVLAKVMKRLIIVSSVLVSLAIAASDGLADSCVNQDQENTEFGVDKGITGQCSNNGMPITCVTHERNEMMCSGPGGDYSGIDLNSLIFSACDCSED